MEKAKLNSLALGYTGAIVAAVIMLLLGILGNIGVYTGAVEAMQQWHVFFSLSIGGIIAGIVEGAVVTFIFVYLFGFIYNKFS
jgi:ABC-type enterobactin transport system permease subunit